MLYGCGLRVTEPLAEADEGSLAGLLAGVSDNLSFPVGVVGFEEGDVGLGCTEILQSPNAQLQIPNRLAGVAAGSFSGGDGDGQKLAGFVPKPVQFLNELLVEVEIAPSVKFPDELQPEGGFIGFFFYGAQLGDEIGFRFSAAGCAVIGGYGGRTALQLAADMADLGRMWEVCAEADDVEGEYLGPVFELSTHFFSLLSLRRGRPQRVFLGSSANFKCPSPN